MFSNLKSKKLITRLFVGLLVLALTVTGSALLVGEFLPKAGAESITVNSESELSSAFGQATSGANLVITLGSDISITGKLPAISSGAVVELKMNGKKLDWYSSVSNEDLASTSYPFANTYFGLITNNGTLKITGSGVISNYKVSFEAAAEQKTNRTIGLNVAAIVNSGSLEISAQITVEGYAAHSCSTSEQGRRAIFMYAHGIYNTGRLVTSGTIQAGSHAQTVAPGNSYDGDGVVSAALAYGIFSNGGVVQVNGGKIYAESQCGQREKGSVKKAWLWDFAVGIYSDNATILGNTTIKTKATSWEQKNGDAERNFIGGGNIMSWSVGVMYSGENYPVIGAAVNIDSGVESGNGNVQFPSLAGSRKNLYSVNVLTDSDFSITKRASAVAGIPASRDLAKAGGTGSAEVHYDKGDAFGLSRTTDFPSRTYISEQVYRTGGTTTTAYTTAVNNENVSDGTVTSYLTAGASGNNINGQYVVIYRYYDTANKLVSASYTPNTEIHSGMEFSQPTGVFTGGATLVRTNEDSGEVTNPYYYARVGVYMRSVGAASFAAVDVNNLDGEVKTKGDSFDPSVGKTLNGGSSVIIYVDYKELPKTNVRVVASNTGVELNTYSTSTTFGLEYMGKNIVPNSDFNIKIIDMTTDTDITGPGTEDYKDVTEFYEISGAQSDTKLQVVYHYSKDGSTWTEGLPKDAGDYKIRVVLPADIDIARPGSGNRYGDTFYLTCTIKGLVPTVSGPDSGRGVYGSNIATLIPTSAYSVVGVNNESPIGTWSYSGYESTSYPTVGDHHITVNWDPSGDSAVNYKKSAIAVTLTVTQRSVTVTPANVSVVYGQTPQYGLTYTNLADCDSAMKDKWLNGAPASGSTAEIPATTFLVYYGGTWQQYNTSMVPGTYEIKINTFGGASDKNNDFSYLDTRGSLTITPAPLYYTATAVSRVYTPGNKNVDIQLAYAGGAINNDTFDMALSTYGTVLTDDAGVDKEVTVSVENINIASPTKYYVAISNVPKVTITKATPDALYSVGSYNSEYDSTRTLASIVISNTNSQVPGTWAWETSSTVPTVDVTKYKAVFTPNNSNNYSSVTTDVTLNITKKPVTISVAVQNVKYGDYTPTLNFTYDGFTGEDNITNVRTTGSAYAETTYSLGKPAGTEYPITVTLRDYEAVNYSFVPQNSKVVVSKKVVNMTLPSINVTYGDDVPEFSVLDLTYPADAFVLEDSISNIGVTFTITTDYAEDSDVGTYQVTATNTAANNYEFTYTPGTVTVGKAELTVTVDNVSVVYNQSAPASFTYTYSGYKFESDLSEITGTPVITTAYKSGDPVNSYPIHISVSSMVSHNYNIKGVGGRITVNRATPVSEDTEVLATVFNGNTYATAVYEYVPTFTDSITNTEIRGSISLTDSSGIADYVASAPEHGVTLSGTFVPADSESYASVPVSVVMLINPKVVSGVPIVKGSAMEGATLTADVSTMSPSLVDAYTYQWYVGGVAVSGATSIAYTVTDADINKTAYVVVKGIEANGYEGSATSAHTAVIVKAFSKTASAEQLDISGLGSYVYTAAGQKATVTKKAAYGNLVGDITVYYNGKANTPWNVGTYVVTVDISAPEVPAGTSEEDRQNYFGPVSGLEIGTIEITPYELGVSVNVADKVYDGTTKIAEGMYSEPMMDAFLSPEEDVRVDWSAFAVRFESAEAGQQKVIVSGLELTGADAYNYKIVVKDTYATIEKATLNATAIGVSRPYNGSATVDVTFSNILGYASIDSSDTVYVASATAVSLEVNAGTHDIRNIQYVLGGSSAGNYVLNITNEKTAKVTITKATPNVAAPEINDLVYNKARTLESIVLSKYYTQDANGYWKFDDLSIVPTVNTKEYAATFVSGNANYSDLKTTIRINLAPKSVTLTAENLTITYGEKPSFVITTDGFTGDDSLSTMGGTQPFATCEYIQGDDVGTYEIGILHNLDSNNNYTFDIVSGLLTVQKANLYVSAEAQSKDYDGTRNVTVRFAVTSGRYGTDTATQVNISNTSTTGTASTENAGTRTVVYTSPTLIGTKAHNYNIVVSPSSGILTVVINKIDPVGVVFPSSAEVQFGYDLSYAQFIGQPEGDGTFAYENAKSTVPSYVGEHIGAYYCEFTPTDNVNYNVLKRFVNLTVTECIVDYVVGISGTAQVGQRLSTSITGLPTKAYEYIKYQWYRVSDGQTIAISGANESVYTLIEDDADFTIVCMTYFDEGAPFVFNEDVGVFFGSYFGIYGETSSTIEEENLTFWQRIVRWIEKLIEALTGLMWTMGG